MTAKEQLDMWTSGEARCPNDNGECCPDFSCCTGKISPHHVRVRFQKAHRENDRATMDEMLMMFLGGALEDENVYVAGGSDTEIHT